MLETIGIILSYVVIFYGGYVWGWNKGWEESQSSKTTHYDKIESDYNRLKAEMLSK